MCIQGNVTFQSKETDSAREKGQGGRDSEYGVIYRRHGNILNDSLYGQKGNSINLRVFAIS